MYKTYLELFRKFYVLMKIVNKISKHVAPRISTSRGTKELATKCLVVVVELTRVTFRVLRVGRHIIVNFVYIYCSK